MNTALITVDSNQSLSSSYTSPPIPMDQKVGVNIQAIWTSTPVGTFKLQTSLSYQPGGSIGNSPPVAGTWDDFPSSSQSSSGVNSCTWNISDAFFRWIRVVYTSTSGSGTLSTLLAEVKGV